MLDKLKKIARLVLLLLLSYQVGRFLFWIFNYSYFSHLSAPDVIRLFFIGIRFDLSAIAITNFLFLVLFIIPIGEKNKKGYTNICLAIFTIVNSISILSNCIDAVYFPYILKRSTFDVFTLITTGNDVQHLLPTFLIDFWYIFLIAVVFILLFHFISKRIITAPEKTPTASKKNVIISTIASFILVVALSIIAFRGGMQLIPIYNVTAAEYTDTKSIPLLLNTPFSIIKTADQQTLTEKNYMTDAEAQKLYSPIRQIKTDSTFKQKNVVFIILESFSKEYIGYYNKGKGYTPFLDSLMKHSLVFENSYANGKRSAEGIPAILASIPTLMTEPYLTSVYGANTISSIASILKTKGYNSSFYHGGTNGTMGFKEFCSIAGFDKYYGRTEYNKEADYDGNWGIWDEPYLQYFNQELSQKKEPFVSAVFTLSSHHPYSLPENHKQKFKGGTMPIHACIEYTDYALQLFFKAAKKEKWYNNTMFVLTADHTGISESIYYGNQIGMYTIPIIFFDPTKNKAEKNYTPTQQLDILPTVLDYIHYPDSFFSFGKSIFDTTQKPMNIQFYNGFYQASNDSLLMVYDGNKAHTIFNYRKDSLLKQPLKQNNSSALKLSNQLKAFLQTYNNCLINNKTTISKK